MRRLLLLTMFAMLGAAACYDFTPVPLADSGAACSDDGGACPSSDAGDAAELDAGGGG